MMGALTYGHRVRLPAPDPAALHDAGAMDRIFPEDR